MGGLPLEELHLAPSDSRASSNGCMGRFLRLESPVKTILSFAKAEMAVAILMVVPELAASIVLLCSFNTLALVTVISSPTSFISTPKFLQALIVALVSPDLKMFLIILLSIANDAKKNCSMCIAFVRRTCYFSTNLRLFYPTIHALQPFCYLFELRWFYLQVRKTHS